MARDMKRNPTPAERLLWTFLAGEQTGHRFQRQKVLFGYIVDFYCRERNIAVELDGPIHEQQEAYDAERTTHLSRWGIRVVRFTNEEVLTDPQRVVRRLIAVA
ncbi:MAG: endonuclease domain-containing protein [Myxococcales bacterium]